MQSVTGTRPGPGQSAQQDTVLSMRFGTVLAGSGSVLTTFHAWPRRVRPSPSPPRRHLLLHDRTPRPLRAVRLAFQDRADAERRLADTVAVARSEGQR